MITAIKFAWHNLIEEIEGSGSFLCWLLGHPMVPTYPISWNSYFHCRRCGMPSNWSAPEGPALLDRLESLYRGLRWDLSHTLWRLSRPIVRRCNDCGKPEFVFGRDVGNHSDCIPF